MSVTRAQTSRKAVQQLTKSIFHIRYVAMLLAMVVVGGLIVPGASPSAVASVGTGPQAVQPAEPQNESGESPFAPPSGEDGVLRLTGPIQMTTIDPALVRDLGHMFLVRQIFAGLMRFNDDLNPVPAIAASYEISDDGLVYTFHLDERARFFDGSQIEASDVVFSLTRALDPSTGNGDPTQLGAPTFLADIEGSAAMLSGEADHLSGLVALDERTVQITLSQPRSTFLMRLASAPASIIDGNDLSLGDVWWQSPNASGPFAIAEFIEDSHIRLEPNSHFVLGSPQLSAVEIRIGAAAFGSLNLYETNAVDFAGVGVENLDRIADPAGPFVDDLMETRLFSVEYLAFRSDVEPLSDPAIREALTIGFPRDRIAETSLNGHVSTAEGLIPDGMLNIDRWEVAHETDRERARALIEESTYGSAENVPPISIYASGTGRAETFRDAIQANLGLRVEVVIVDWVSYLSGLSRGEFPAYLLYWGADYPDPESMLLSLFGSDSADNYVGYASDEFDSLMERAAEERDPASRAALYQQANQLLMDDAVVLALYYDVAYTLVRPWVHGLVMTPLGVMYLDTVTIDSSAGG